jgi:hypothetical protein
MGKKVTVCSVRLRTVSGMTCVEGVRGVGLLTTVQDRNEEAFNGKRDCRSAISVNGLCQVLHSAIDGMRQARHGDECYVSTYVQYNIACKHMRGMPFSICFRARHQTKMLSIGSQPLVDLRGCTSGQWPLAHRSRQSSGTYLLYSTRKSQASGPVPRCMLFASWSCLAGQDATRSAAFRPGGLGQKPEQRYATHVGVFTYCVAAPSDLKLLAMVCRGAD